MEDRQTAQKLEERLTCSICLKIYVEPRLLNCSHMFCTACLRELISKFWRDRSKPFTFPCPTCREEATILNDIVELKPSYQTNQFLDVLKDLKAEPPSRSLESGAGSLRSSSLIESTIVIHDDPPATCPSHNNMICNLFCRTCNTFICGSCTVVEHHSHNYNEVAVELTRTKEELSSSLSQLDRTIQVLEDGISNIALQRKCIIDRKSAIESDIRSKMESLHKVLDDRLSELVGDLNLVTERKLSGLKAEKDQVDSKLIPLVQFRNGTKAMIEASSQQKLLREKKRLTKTLQQKLNSCQSIDSVVVQTKADIQFSCSPFISDNCRNYGNVYAPGFPCPSKCYADGEGLEKATVGVSTFINLTVLDYLGKLCKEMMIESLECRLESESGAFVNGMVEHMGCGKYRIKYLPVVRGEHLLHVEIEKDNIKESPFAVKVECPVEKLGTLVRSFADLEQPCGVAITSTGNLVIAEKGGKTVSMVQPSGKKFKSFDGLPGTVEDMRCGMAVDKSSNIMLVDTHNHCIVVFSRDGELIITLGSMGSGQLNFLFPQDVAFNSNNSCYYVVDLNNRVQILHPDLSFYRFFGSYGSGSNQFNTPHGISCDDSGNVYIADTNNHRIVVTTSQGKFLRKFTPDSDKRFMPISVAVDSSHGRVYVGEANGYIKVFSLKGEQLSLFDVGEKASGSSLTKGLFAICVHKNGMLYVCATGSDCVKVY